MSALVCVFVIVRRESVFWVIEKKRAGAHHMWMRQQRKQRKGSGWLKKYPPCLDCCCEIESGTHRRQAKESKDREDKEQRQESKQRGKRRGELKKEERRKRKKKEEREKEGERKVGRSLPPTSNPPASVLFCSVLIYWLSLSHFFPRSSLSLPPLSLYTPSPLLSPLHPTLHPRISHIHHHSFLS
jgi:hypothetical protein